MRMKYRVRATCRLNFRPGTIDPATGEAIDRASEWLDDREDAVSLLAQWVFAVKSPHWNIRIEETQAREVGE